MTSSSSRPKPAVPAARRIGFWKVVPNSSTALTGAPALLAGRVGCLQESGERRDVEA